jgi:hypothetical protein
MSVKAILRKGHIEPLDPLPADWADGEELLIEKPERIPSDDELDQWAKDLEESASSIPQEEHDRLDRALDEIEKESKDVMRRKWGLS